MSPARAIRLVAVRDFRERIRSKAFLVSSALTILLIVALIVAPALLDGNGESPRYLIGVVGDTPPDLANQLEAAVIDDATVNVSRFSGVAVAEDALQNGLVDLVVVGTSEVLTGPETDSRLATVAPAALAVAAFLERAAELGIPADELARLLDPDIGSRELEAADPNTDENRTLALIGTIFLFVSIVTYGQWILIGVVEEKSNRVVEVVLGAIRPHHLLTGKVLGIGLLGLVQLVVLVAIGLTLAFTVSGLELPPATGNVIVAVALWFVLGYVFYGTAYAAAGSLVSRQEEAQNAAFPLTILLMSAYFVAVFSFEGDNPVLALFSILPVFAPVTMPVRMAAGDAAVWEVVASVVLMVVGTYALVRIAGRVYSGGLLRTGGKVRIREAWQGAER